MSERSRRSAGVRYGSGVRHARKSFGDTLAVLGCALAQRRQAMRMLR